MLQADFSVLIKNRDKRLMDCMTNYANPGLMNHSGWLMRWLMDYDEFLMVVDEDLSNTFQNYKLSNPT